MCFAFDVPCIFGELVACGGPGLFSDKQLKLFVEEISDSDREDSKNDDAKFGMPQPAHIDEKSSGSFCRHSYMILLIGTHDA